MRSNKELERDATVETIQPYRIPLYDTVGHTTVGDGAVACDARALEFALEQRVIRRVARPTDIEAAHERLYGETADARGAAINDHATRLRYPVEVALTRHVAG
jgi:hypothetical protein